MAAEDAIAGIRLLVIASGTVIYPFLMDKAGTIPWLAYTLLALAWVFGLHVYLAKPHRTVPLLRSSYFIAGTDALFTTLWLYATGGVASPFFVALYGGVASLAFRYRAREAFASTALYASAYVGMVVALGQAPGHVAELATRVVYLFFVAGIGVAVSRELTRQTETTVQLRQLSDGLAMEVEHRRAAEARLAHSEAQLAEAQAVSHTGSWEWDMTTSAVWWSDEMFRIYGYEARSFEVTFARAMEHVHPEDAGAIQRGLKEDLARFQGPEMAARGVRYRIVLPDGSVRFLRGGGRFVAGKDGKPERVIGFVQDVTEQVRADEDVRAAEDSRRELEHLRRVDGFKTRFLNTAAHELNTPLTPIKVQLHILRAYHAKDLGDDGRTALRIVERNFDRLAHLVGDLLDAARLEAGKLPARVQDAELNRVVAATVESFREAATAAKLDLRLQLGPEMPVRADPLRLEQVLFNLLDNAIKFTPPGGTLLVATAREDDEAVVRVRDTGLGLRPEDAARLFQPFVQVHEPTPRMMGTGLGLYISRGILESHGGRIWAESDGPGEGSTFGFALPLRGATATAEVAPPSQYASPPHAIPPPSEDVSLDAATPLPPRRSS